MLSQQAISTPGVRFNNFAVEKGATYEYSVVGKTSKANAYPWVEGCGQNIVWHGPQLPTSLSRVTVTFTVPLDCSTDTVNLGVLWSDLSDENVEAAVQAPPGLSQGSHASQ